MWGGVAVAGFFLQHEHHALGKFACDDGVHPRRGDGIGEVGHDLITSHRYGLR